MGAYSFFHWIIVLLVFFIVLFPTVKILNKAGYSGWWAVLTLVPLVNIVVVWVFAFADWPALRQPRG